jgi:uncharacterized protein (TIGR03435 family)
MTVMGALLLLVALQVARFDVVSVKLVKSPAPMAQFGAGQQVWTPEITRFSAITVRELIRRAYEIDYAAPYTAIEGGNMDVLQQYVEIEGRGGSGTQEARLRALLAERFGLRVHREVRQVRMWALRIKTPGKLKPSPVNCIEQLRVPLEQRPEVCRLHREVRYGAPVERSAGTLDELGRTVIQGMLYGVPLVNQTGLVGNYEWDFAFTRTGQPDAPSIFTALEDQLGLKLEETVGPFEILIVDDLQMPIPN